MRKVIIILIIDIVISGCSITRKGITGITENSKVEIESGTLESVQRQNITNDNFFVQKAEIEIITQSGKEKFIGNLKYVKPDKYLISLKNNIGIEGARIYLAGDTIEINDRINKKVYFGNSYYMKKKYGLTTDFLPLILGDVVIDKGCINSKINCQENQINIACVNKGVRINYTIDCKKRKAILVSQNDNYNKTEFTLEYGSFFNNGNIVTPRIIKFNKLNYNTQIKIRICKIEFQWNGKISFIPGKGYELIELL